MTNDLTPELIRATRKAIKRTQHQFGTLLGVSNVTVARWEAGANSPKCDKHRQMILTLANKYLN